MTIAYLATPYTKTGDLERAFRAACALAGRLIKAGVHVYSPIAHTHPIAIYGEIDPLDQEFWYAFDRTMLERCDALIVAHMDGWEQSSGIAHEIEVFVNAGKPVFDLNVETLAMTKRVINDWRPADTMPYGRTVTVKTATGLIRSARRARGHTTVRGGVHCWRADKSGDLTAMFWRENG